ncbi:MAG: heat-shock protein SP21 [Isosphaera sp.]|nr:heat-shock protein SP21 [Isosphaera sp.]
MSTLVRRPEAAPAAVNGTGEEQAVTLTPRVDVLETENEFLVLADLPGVKPDQVDIRFEKGEMSVHGRRPGGRDRAATHYHRVFAVAETVAADRITADLKAGVLTVKLPKVEAVKPKRIAVTG